MADQVMHPQPGVCINIYVDDSNISIGGRNYYRIYQQNNPRAPYRRYWSYDIEKLGDIIKKKLAQEHGLNENDPNIHNKYYLYGANLHANPKLGRMRGRPGVKFVDCPWNTWKKEKLADCRLTADMTDQVNNVDQFTEATYFVVLSGDADMVPAVEKAMEHDFVVHVWCWSQSLSWRLKRLGKNRRGRVKVHKLNERILDFTL